MASPFTRQSGTDDSTYSLLRLPENAEDHSMFAIGATVPFSAVGGNVHFCPERTFDDGTKR